MTLNKPQVLLLSIAIATAVAACSKPEAAAGAAGAADTVDAPRFTLDETNLPGVNRFAQGDVNPDIDACTDFNGHINGKWLAANDIPSDRTSWGAFEMLDERSNAVQRQLAEQAAAMTDANGVEKIVGDMWATGMDEARINEQGIAPIQPRLDEIAALDSQDKLADYLRSAAASGNNVLFGFYAGPDFKDSANNIA